MSKLYVGVGRSAGPAAPQWHNPDVNLKVSGTGASRTAAPTVVVRNDGSTEPACSIMMCWSQPTTGPVLTACELGGAPVEIPAFTLNGSSVSSPKQFPTFPVPSEAQRLVAVVFSDGEYANSEWACEVNPVCGVQNL